MLNWHYQSSTNANINSTFALSLYSFITGSPARIHMWTRTRLEMIGSEVRLFCRASGSPQPTISWVGPDDHPIASDTKYNIMENGDLVIKDLSWSDMGGFTCIASNQNGDDRSSTFLYPTMVSFQRTWLSWHDILINNLCFLFSALSQPEK